MNGPENPWIGTDSISIRLIDKHLHSLLEAAETKFFPWRKTTKRKTEQIVETREVADNGIRLGALDVAFRLRGDYAPKQLDDLSRYYKARPGATPHSSRAECPAGFNAPKPPAWSCRFRTAFDGLIA